MKALLPLALAAALAASFGCKKDDPMDEAKRVLQEDPAKAIPLLKEQYQQDPSNYDTIRGLAQAYSSTENWERAAAWYRKALEHPSGAESSEKQVLQDGLLAATLHQIEAGRTGNLEPSKLLTLLKQANALEQELGRQNIEAGKTLFDMAKARLEAHVKAAEFDKAIAEIKALDTIYVDQKLKQTLLDRLPEIERAKFEAAVNLAFEGGIRAQLEEGGYYDAEQKAFVLTGISKFEVSEPGEPGTEGGPDPKDPNFGKAMQDAACSKELGIVRIKALLDPFATATPLGRGLNDREAGVFYKFAMQRRAGKWDGEVWDATREYEPGTTLTYVCKDLLPLETVVKGFDAIRTAPPPAN